jgi:hypothetical protein
VKIIGLIFGIACCGFLGTTLTYLVISWYYGQMTEHPDEDIRNQNRELGERLAIKVGIAAAIGAAIYMFLSN